MGLIQKFHFDHNSYLLAAVTGANSGLAKDKTMEGRCVYDKTLVPESSEEEVNV